MATATASAIGTQSGVSLLGGVVSKDISFTTVKDATLQCDFGSRLADFSYQLIASKEVKAVGGKSNVITDIANDPNAFIFACKGENVQYNEFPLPTKELTDASFIVYDGPYVEPTETEKGWNGGMEFKFTLPVKAGRVQLFVAGLATIQDKSKASSPSCTINGKIDESFATSYFVSKSSIVIVGDFEDKVPYTIKCGQAVAVIPTDDKGNKASNELVAISAYVNENLYGTSAFPMVVSKRTRNASSIASFVGAAALTIAAVAALF